MNRLKTVLLETLTWRCRCASDLQLAVALAVSPGQLQCAVRALISARLLDCRSLRVATPELNAPLALWRQGHARADFAAIAWQLQRRWNQAPQPPRRVIWATRLAPRLVGGVGGLRQPLQLEHDLGVSEIFTRRSFHERSRWLSEDLLIRSGHLPRRAKVPDAAIVDDRDRIVRVIELGGQYSRQRLEAFHAYWALRQHMAYEIW